MADNGMKGRMKGLLTGTSVVFDAAEQVETPAPEPMSRDVAQRQALQVLTLAQRTADEHVADAHRQADKICADARAMAEQIVRDAQAHADDLKREADRTLAEGRAIAERIGREAQAHAATAHREADEILTDARGRADEVVKAAQANADELDDQAQRRYQDVVGSLATKRESLQQQIEALEQFDREYLTRLTTFMQAQMRALWADEPQVDPEPLDGSDGSPAPVPAQRGG
jgi:cell division septum initiation protein DivIVA